MPQATYQRLLTERVQSRARWENQPADGYSLSDLEHEEILRTVRLGIAAGRLPESTGKDISDILSRLGLFKEGTLNDAAVVLFGTRFMPDYPQCQLRMARFRGVNKSEFLDQRQIEGHAFTLLEEAMLFLRRHLPVAGRIVPGLFEREDEPLFPLEALREALVNAFCHRDYTIIGGAVSLAIFDDRLEIWSDGALPFGLKPEDLKRNHPSRPRNPLIAQVSYLRGVIERWGRGTQKIVELCVKAGHPEPDTIPYNWEDISTSGTQIALSDDQMSGAIPLGFTFDYFGNSYSDIYVSSNGFLTVLPGQYNGCCSGQPIPTPGDPDGVIAGWWNDLYPPGGGPVTYQTLGSAPNRYVIVQFTNVPHC